MMNFVNIKDSIAKCQKHIYKYSDGTKLRFDLIEDPEEREKAILLSEYLWVLKECEKVIINTTKMYITDYPGLKERVTTEMKKE